VDEKWAFVGGIDLAYGRYDDHYGLLADAEGRRGMNMYNPCIPPIVHGTGYDPRDEYVIPVGMHSREHQQDELKRAENRQAKSVQNIINTVLEHKLWQAQGSAKDNLSLEPGIQPRMPWQDYQVQIEGPAVDDLMRNFILRWNSYSPRYPVNPLQTQIPPLEMPEPHPAKKGSCQVQVLRSASLTMRRDEYKKMPAATSKPRMKQDDILRSLHLLISKAEHYIYIENQFFVSAFGESSIGDNSPLSPAAKSINPSLSAWATRILPDDDLPRNPVAEWLGERIKRAIFSHMKHPFHVYIVLPVYPEGRLDDPAIVAQIHLTRQSLVFGSHSLLNRIRRSLWVKQQLEDQGVPRKEWCRKIAELEELCAREYDSIPLEACDEYVTLLNLRDYAELNGMAVTEQIYVHSKLTIVDDRYVLMGSANINDRSLEGDRDSELAVLISDTEHGYTDLDGSGTLVPYRKFARELRQRAWRKWMGSAAEECAAVLDKPALKAGWEKIQTLAKENAVNYESIFNFIPRNVFITDEVSNSVSRKENSGQEDKLRPSLWPVMPANSPAITSVKDSMPFSVSCWEMYKIYNHNLINIKGFFTALPIHWAKGENNLIPFNMRLIAIHSQQAEEVQIANNQNINNPQESQT
jgi:phospholipase D1/2